MSYRSTNSLNIYIIRDENFTLIRSHPSYLNRVSSEHDDDDERRRDERRIGDGNNLIIHVRTASESSFTHKKSALRIGYKIIDYT